VHLCLAQRGIRVAVGELVLDVPGLALALVSLKLKETVDAGVGRTKAVLSEAG